MSVLEHPAVESFDTWADRRLEHLRGQRVADRVFVAATELGDFSLIWHLVGVTRGLTSVEHAKQAFVFSTLIGAESLIVNQGVTRGDPLATLKVDAALGEVLPELVADVAARVSASRGVPAAD